MIILDFTDKKYKSLKVQWKCSKLILFQNLVQTSKNDQLLEGLIFLLVLLVLIDQQRQKE
jgi:hypothetical protein